MHIPLTHTSKKAQVPACLVAPKNKEAKAASACGGAAGAMCDIANSSAMCYVLNA
jgi:hypothetical protein